MNTNVNGNINFSFEYAVSIIIILVVCNILVKTNPQMNTIVVIILGLLVGYISLWVMNKVFPAVNKTASNVGQYYNYQFMNNFSNMGYIHVWPPILAVLVIFIILLYNKNLG